MIHKYRIYEQQMLSRLSIILFSAVLFALFAFLGIFPIGRAIMILPISAQDIIRLMFNGALIGIGLALIEILLLGSLIQHRIKWLFATILGCIVGWIIGGYLGSLLMNIGADLFGVGGYLSALGFSVPVGAFVGVFQSLFLSASMIRKILWILIVSIAWTVAWFSLVPINLLIHSDAISASILNSGMFGLVFSLLIAVFAVKIVVGSPTQAAAG